MARFAKFLSATKRLKCYTNIQICKFCCPSTSLQLSKLKKRISLSFIGSRVTILLPTRLAATHCLKVLTRSFLMIWVAVLAEIMVDVTGPLVLCLHSAAAADSDSAAAVSPIITTESFPPHRPRPAAAAEWCRVPSPHCQETVYLK